MQVETTPTDRPCPRCGGNLETAEQDAHDAYIVENGLYRCNSCESLIDDSE